MGSPYRSNISALQVPVHSLAWTAEKSFLGFGVRFGLRTNNAQGLERALAYLPLGWQEIPKLEADVQYSLHMVSPSQDSAISQEYLLYANSELIARGPTSAPILEKLAEHSRLLTTLYATERLFVHAGVVGWQGHAILIPGRSFSGKTTLVQALLEAGASYYSDEFAVLDEKGYTHPYPLPLSIRAADGTVSKTPFPVPCEQIGRDPLPVKLIVLTGYHPGAQWRPLPLSPSRAMLALMANTVAARREPQFSMPILRAAVLRASTVESLRGEAESIASAILNLPFGA